MKPLTYRELIAYIFHGGHTNLGNVGVALVKGAAQTSENIGVVKKA